MRSWAGETGIAGGTSLGEELAKTAATALRRAFAIALTVTLAAIVAVVSSPAPAQAANAGDFQAGNIISDDVFFNGGTMSEAKIQSFLNSKVPSCRSGYTCLRDYRQDTYTIDATPMCARYDGARNETAARMIYKVAVTCGINPQALLVMLQKEQGLVNDDWPSARQYRSAMGAGCPDTADCDVNYYGFFNQLHYGAYLLKRYTQPAGTGAGTEYSSRFDLSYPVGRTSYIQYNPNAACGGQNVYITNQATHALYVYTPYTPTSAALAAGYGSAGNCSAYGNRNFFLYFTDWFGPAQFLTTGWIGDKYYSIGGVTSRLGMPLENEQAVDGGAVQDFAGGSIYCSAAGAYVVRGWIGDKYAALRANTSYLGWPIADEESTTSGARQRFQGGQIITTTRGAFALATPVMDAYQAAGVAKVLGTPTGDSQQLNGSYFAEFSGGTLLVGPKGTYTARGSIGDKYRDVGGPSSWLGWPLGKARSMKGGTVQDFENGSIIATSAGAFATSTAIAVGYDKMGGRAVVGDPRRDGVVKSSGSSQVFKNGSILASSKGTFLVRGWIADRYALLGSQTGDLGWPTSNEKAISGGARQTFTGGTVVSSAAGAYAVIGAIADKYKADGAESGALGFPLADAVSKNSGREQRFQGGKIESSKAGAWSVRGWIGDKYSALGASSSPLRWPTEDEKSLPNGARQTFKGGYIYSSAAGAFESRGWIGDKFQASGGQSGYLGYPISDERPIGSGVMQSHQYGAVLCSSAGTFVVRGWIGDRYLALGGATSRLGFPLGDERQSGGDAVQDFKGGRIVVNAKGITVTYK